MSNINPQLNRSDFFSKAKPTRRRLDSAQMRRNSFEKKREIESSTKNDVKVDISNKMKDFARIKSAVDRESDRDNSSRMMELKEQINKGAYNINYDTLAEKMLQSEF